MSKKKSTKSRMAEAAPLEVEEKPKRKAGHYVAKGCSISCSSTGIKSEGEEISALDLHKDAEVGATALAAHVASGVVDKV
jgi:hypothetical protein